MRKEASATVAQLKEKGTSRELLDQLFDCFTRAPFTASIRAPVFLASATLHASSGDCSLALDHLNKADHLLRMCKGAKSGEYKQLLERRRLISKQLQQKQHEEKGESICS